MEPVGVSVVVEMYKTLLHTRWHMSGGDCASGIRKIEYDIDYCALSLEVARINTERAENG